MIQFHATGIWLSVLEGNDVGSPTMLNVPQVPSRQTINIAMPSSESRIRPAAFPTTEEFILIPSHQICPSAIVASEIEHVAS